MTRDVLIAKVAEDTCRTKKVSSIVLNSVLDCITDTLQADENINGTAKSWINDEML